MMTNQSRYCSRRVLRWLAAGLLCAAPSLNAGKLPPLWGYGVKSCSDYLSAAKGWEAGVETEIAEYRRYEDWLTGFVSGLNLATGEDVLKGADIDSALRRTRAYCEGHRKQDFFNASMDFVRMLSKLR
ncbi:MAG: hypothetical protein WCA32_00720 [Chromatiaceae bacterium]|jgi:hypothetical protein